MHYTQICTKMLCLKGSKSRKRKKREAGQSVTFKGPGENSTELLLKEETFLKPHFLFLFNTVLD